MLLILWLLEAVSGLAAGATSVFQALSLSAHFGDFSQGAINLEDVVYYLSMTIGALFVATRVLETRRYNA
jgi:ABC-2 type transport system permease protein